MVYLILSRSGYEQYRSMNRSASDALWLTPDVLTHEELTALRLSGADASVFNYTIEPDEGEVITGAVETINEHHPKERVEVLG